MLVENLYYGGHALEGMAEKQEMFFQHLKNVQEQIVINAMSEHKSNGSLENLLYDVSYDAIYRIMELIDGYADCDIKVDLIDKQTDESMRNNIELHDKCAEYLWHTE